MSKGKKKTRSNAKKLLAELKEKFNLIESPKCKDVLSKVNLTYSYINDFIACAKKKEKICLTAIAKTNILAFATLDIEQCLKLYGADETHTIYYVDYQFDTDYNCPHGEEFKNVWIMFFARDEQFIIDMLIKFQKLKAFI